MIIFILLILIIILLLFLLKNNNDFFKVEKQKSIELQKEVQLRLENKENEVSTHIETIKTFQSEKNGLEKNYKKLENNYFILENMINKHKMFAKNIGEVMASRDLTNIFNTFKNSGIVKHFHIIDNILFSDDNTVRQIDHFIVCDFGIFMIETKTWKGDIFFNLSSDMLKNTEYSFLNRYLFKNKKHHTVVLKNDKDGHFVVSDYGNPFVQVMKSVKKIYKHFDNKYFVNGLVYFNYKSDHEEYIFFDGSNTDSPIKAVSNKESLESYFLDIFKKTKNKQIDIFEIDEIHSKIKNYIIL